VAAIDQIPGEKEHGCQSRKQIDQQLTYEFYDYNQPRTIKAPENYKP